MAKKFPKLIIIENNKSLNEAITIIQENDYFQNHMQYYQELLNKKNFQNVNLTNITSLTRNTIGAQICLEGNIVFMDISKTYSTERIGILFLPKQISLEQKEFLEKQLSNYDIILQITNIHYNNANRLTATEKWVFKSKIDNKNKTYTNAKH